MSEKNKNVNNEQFKQNSQKIKDVESADRPFIKIVVIKLMSTEQKRGTRNEIIADKHVLDTKMREQIRNE